MNAHTRMFSSAGHSDGAASSRSIIETGNLARDNAILTEQVRRVEAALDNMSQGLCLFDADSRLVVCNRRYHEIFKLPPGTLTFGLTQREICSILIDNGSYPSSVTLEGIRESTHVALRRSTGTPVLRELADGRTLSVLYRTLPDGGWVSTFEDITQQRLSEARIEHLARHDGLTDLANARTLREESGSLLANVSAEAPILALLYLDLDRFKFVNDTYGHDIGDELLRAVAGRLRAATCRNDRVSRLGGDEFAVMRRVRVPDEALSFARRLIQSISAPYDLSTGKVEVGTSIGVAIRHGAVSDVEPLLQEADFALRHVKATDRGIVSLFDPAMSDAARLRRSLESELHMALAAGQFEVHYQPLIDLDGKRPVGAEALVRWRHPERGLVPPASFIPVAEEIGLIVAIGEWVMRQACHDAMTWPEHMTVAVNVSSFQMRHKTFAGTVLAALSEAHLPPDRLEIEITESALLDESETIMRNLNALRTAGIRFAMDDFGTGYSSLSYLRRFPIDKIKIDKSFMKDAEANSDALAIIRAVAGLGVSLGITTLIEGVETSEQLDLARAEGVRQVQGFLFSRPLPNDIMSPMLKGEMPLSFLETNPPLS